MNELLTAAEGGAGGVTGPHTADEDTRYERVDFSGGSARGRNGYFVPKTGEAMTWKNYDAGRYNVRASVMSKRAGDADPISLELAPEEMLRFAEMLASRARAAMRLNEAAEREASQTAAAAGGGR